MKNVQLNAAEMAALMESAVSRDLGWHSFLMRLQSDLNQTTGDLPLADSDLQRIQRFAFDRGNDRWKGRMTAVFGRHLGSKLGRP